MTPETYTLTPFTGGVLDEAALEAMLREETPQRVLVDCDLFAPGVEPDDRAAVLACCCLATQHTIFLVAQSRLSVEWMASWFRGDLFRPSCDDYLIGRLNIDDGLAQCINERAWGGWSDHLAHLWLGARITCQEDADERLPHLARLAEAGWNTAAWCVPLRGDITLDDEWLQMEGSHPGDALGSGIRWVICGGETGPAARGMDPGWASWLREQCHAVGVPFWYTGSSWALGSRDRGTDMVLLSTGQVITEREYTERGIRDKLFRLDPQMVHPATDEERDTLDGLTWRELPEWTVTP